MALDENMLGVFAIFATIVLPIVLWFAWAMKRDRGQRLGSADSAALSGLADTARRIEQRLEALERVLDTDAPGWRTGRITGGRPS